MLYRDEQDSQRSVSPLRVPEGAITIDTTDKNINETVKVMMENYHKIFGEINWIYRLEALVTK